MNLTRRSFSSRLGWLLAGASAGNAWAGAATPQEPQHSREPMTTHAWGSAENKLAPEDELWANLLTGNQRFVAGKPATRELVKRREELLAGQHPQVAVLTCSDSRVDPTIVFDQNLGSLFVVRTDGNVADTVALGSIEYAVSHLPIRLLVILGHEKCGAVAAAASGEKMSSPNLAAVIAKIAPAVAKVKGKVEGEALLRAAEEANVQQVAADVLANSPIVLQETAAQNLEIIKAIYSLKTGQVRRLTAS